MITFLIVLCMAVNNQPITFTLPVGTEYEANLLSFEHENSQIEAIIEVGPEVWETVDMVMLFNLKWNDRNEGSVSGTKPVRIRMFLDKELYQTLKDENNLITDEKSFLASDRNHPMRSSTKWFGVEVTEEVTLPDSLKNLGTVREGFTTKWLEEYR